MESYSSIFSIKTNPVSMYIALLSQEELIICDSSQYGCKEITRYSRTNELQLKYGPNYWVQWIDKTCIAWGTCSGIVFISNLTENGLEEPKIYNLDIPITTTFSAYGYLAICQSNSTIQFFDREGKQISELNLEKGVTKFKSPKFTYSRNFSAVLGGSPFVAFLDESAILHKSPFLYRFEDENHATMSSFMPQRNGLAFALDNNSVYVMILNKLDKSRIKITDPRPQKIVKLEWSKNSYNLYIIYADGLFTVFYPDVATTCSVMIPELAGAIDIDIDPFSQQIFYTTFDRTGVIYIAESNRNVFFTPENVYSFITKKYLTNSSNIPSELFPIRFATTLDQNTFVAANSGGFCLIKSDESISNFVKTTVKNISFIDKYLVVFSERHDDWYTASVYNLDLEIVTTFEINHIPLTISVYDNTMIVGCQTHMTKVTITTENSPIPLDDKFITLEKTEVAKTPRNILTFGENIIMHYTDRNCSYLSGLPLAKNIRYCWTTRDPDVAVLQSTDKVYLLFRGILFNFNGVVLFNDNARLYYLANTMNFQSVQLIERLYTPYFIVHFYNEPSIYEYFYKLYAGTKTLIDVFSNVLLLSIVKECHQEVVINCVNILPDIELANVIIQAFYAMRMPDKLNFMKFKIIPWRRVFKYMPASEQAKLITNVDPNDLQNFVEDISPLNNYDDVVKGVLAYSALVPAYFVIRNGDKDLAKYIQNLSATVTSWGLYYDKTRYPEQQFNEIINDLEKAGEKVKNYALLFGIYLAMNDPRAAEIEANHPELKEDIEQARENYSKRK